MTGLLQEWEIPLRPISERPRGCNWVNIDGRRLLVPGICPVSGTAASYAARRRQATLQMQENDERIEALREERDDNMPLEKRAALDRELHALYDRQSALSAVAASPWDRLFMQFKKEAEEMRADAIRW